MNGLSQVFNMLNVEAVAYACVCVYEGREKKMHSFTN